MTRTVSITSNQYMWWSSARNTLTASSMMLGAFAHLGMVRVIAAAAVVFGALALLDEATLRIEGQSPRVYYRTHETVTPRGFHVLMVVLLIIFVGASLLLCRWPGGSAGN